MKLDFSLSDVAASRGYSVSDAIGYIGDWLDTDADGGAVEQINRNYAHGGGWSDFEGFTFDKQQMALLYNGDEPTYALAGAVFSQEEFVMVFEHGWVAVMNRNGSMRVARID